MRLTALVRFQPFENVTVDLMERWRNAMNLGGDPTQNWVSNHVESFATTNINLAYQHETDGMTMEYYVNVQNVFNADAPNGAYSGNGTRAGLRDERQSARPDLSGGSQYQTVNECAAGSIARSSTGFADELRAPVRRNDVSGKSGTSRQARHRT